MARYIFDLFKDLNAAMQSCIVRLKLCYLLQKKYDVQVSDSPSTETRIKPALTFLAQKEDQMPSRGRVRACRSWHSD
jgi:hypothetical protein